MTVEIGELPGDDGGGGGGGGYVPPAFQSGDWAKIATLVGAVTPYRSVNFSRQVSGVADLNGVYTILSVASDHIVLSNPALVNANWNSLSGSTAYTSPALSTSGERWIGPFIIDADDTDRLLANFIAANGLYKDDGKSQTPFAQTVMIETTPVDADDVPIGAAEDFFITIPGNTNDRETHAETLWCMPSFTGRQSVRARRVTPTDLSFSGSVVDEVKWRDLYGAAQVPMAHFGNVTTIMARTFATNGALSVKERKLNMTATRLIPQRIAGTEFGDLIPSNSVDDILAAVCLDPFIGRRPTSQVDFDNIYDTVAEIAEYFGSDRAKEFGFTFDDANMSSEETITTIAQAIGCSPYRQGHQIKIHFEKATDDSTLLFNGRNMLPGTQKTSIRFGPFNDHDGVQLDWNSPRDGAKLSFNVPTDLSATSAMTVDLPGIGNSLLAYWQGWRARNKMLYQNVSTEFEATQEASLVIRGDRIVVEDLTRPQDILGGEIVAIDGTRLTLSDVAELDGDEQYTIFIQHIDRTIEALGCVPVIIDMAQQLYEVDVSAVPRLELALNPNNYTRAKYQIVRLTDERPRAFILDKRDQASNFTQTITAINYSFLYYQHDELIAWLPGPHSTFEDQGPYARDVVLTGDIDWVADVERGVVMACNGGHLGVTGLVAPASYTKAAWLKPSALAGTQTILSSPDGTEAFEFVGGAVRAGHAALEIDHAWPDDGAWHYAVLTFDQPSGDLDLYLDGEPAQAASTGDRALGALEALTGFIGECDTVKLWKRALTAAEIKAVFRAELESSIALGTEAGSGSITLDDGRRIILE